MKVYIVVIDFNYEGHSTPYFVGSTEENAQKWIDTQLKPLADYRKESLETFKEKNGNSDYEIIEMEVDVM